LAHAQGAYHSASTQTASLKHPNMLTTLGLI
jgi:hypothetical protein